MESKKNQFQIACSSMCLKCECAFGHVYMWHWQSWPSITLRIIWGRKIVDEVSGPPRAGKWVCRCSSLLNCAVACFFSTTWWEKNTECQNWKGDFVMLKELETARDQPWRPGGSPKVTSSDDHQMTSNDLQADRALDHDGCMSMTTRKRESSVVRVCCWSLPLTDVDLPGHVCRSMLLCSLIQGLDLVSDPG